MLLAHVLKLMDFKGLLIEVIKSSVDLPFLFEFDVL